MRIPTGPGSSVTVGELAALVARSILPVKLDERLAALEREVLDLRARVRVMEADLPPGVDPLDPGG